MQLPPPIAPTTSTLTLTIEAHKWLQLIAPAVPANWFDSPPLTTLDLTSQLATTRNTKPLETLFSSLTPINSNHHDHLG